MAVGPFQPQLRLLTIACFHLQRWEIRNMRAPYWRLYRNRDSGGELALDGETTAIDPGWVVAVPPETPCISHLRQPVTHTFLHFVARPPYAAMPRRLYRWKLPPAMAAVFDRLQARLVEHDESDPVVGVHAHAAVGWALAQVPEADLSTADADQRIERSLAAIDEDEGGLLTNRDLARVAGMHPTAFVRRFRQVTGTTPQAMAMGRRIERAASMLLAGDGDIAAVAEATGFCDRAHFSRTFKRYRGMGPGGFRDLMRAGHIT